MKIIFDNELEKDFFIRKFCPLDVLDEANEICYAYEGSPHKCEECWRNNIEMEVRDAQ